MAPLLDAVAMSVIVTELQDALMARKNALMAQEDDLAATECALGRACMECDTECDKAEAIPWDYQASMSASTADC
jgi:hypothetical protein